MIFKSGMMCYLRVYSSVGGLMLNMLPARSPDGTVGFFDTVRKGFHTLASGTLIAGDVISHRRLSYVRTQSDNASMYVNTSYKLTWISRTG
ncbi:MAG: hypothetical protein J6Z49_02210 [Kiritimatiellae bacterium]|nr:hypothetical protein [Kiritimatiellia bacterium]